KALINKIGNAPAPASLEEQVITRRCRAHDNVAARLGFAPIPIKHAIDSVKILAAPGKREDGRVCSRRIVIVRQDDLISDRDSPKPAGLADYLGMRLKRECQQKRNDGDRRQPHLLLSAVIVLT